MAFIRLDKMVSQSGERTRSEAAKLIRAGLISVDGLPVTDPARKVDASCREVLFEGRRIMDEPYQYWMLHKPKGVLTAARDRRAQTVMELVPKPLSARKVMPVGRLDKDTTGLVLLTNDGALAHDLLSPKKHVWKEYRVTVDGPLRQKDVEAFARGMALRDFTAKPASLRIEKTSAEESVAIVRLREGKHHQVKRMFAALGLRVTALHRQGFGPLKLDLPPGGYRALEPQEIEALYAAADGE